MVLRRLKSALARPVDGASLAAFRIGFGVLMMIAVARFFTHRWIDADYRFAKVFFPYWGLAFIRPWPGIGMYMHYAVMAVCALCIALGIFYRGATLLFAITFTYAHLCDKANYLNHYYLISLISLLLLFLPLDRNYSLRVLLRPADRCADLPAWMLYLLRFQFGVVYVFGGLGKLGVDWLIRSEPLRIWLMADADLPALRHFAGRAWLAPALSWGGFLFDLAVVPLLLIRATRRWAYCAAIVFHTTTALLFHIGLFPWLMLVGATLYFDPSWPRFSVRTGSHAASRPASSWLVGALALYALVQIAVPLRSLLYPGNVLWSEEGFRFSWRVMLIEKSGALTLTVVDRAGRRFDVSPRRYLTPFQTRMAATQPDMIRDLAHIVARDFAARGRGQVQVFADAQVSWNGRHSAPLVDPTIDLAHEADSLLPKQWILPAPTAPPIF